MTIEIYLLDHEKQTKSRIGIADNDPGVLEICQYLIDGMGDLEQVALYSPEKDAYFSTAKLIELTGLRKRTFDERMRNVPSWHLPEM